MIPRAWPFVFGDGSFDGAWLLIATRYELEEHARQWRAVNA